MEKFAAEVKKLKVGNGADDTIEVGPLINQSGLEKVVHHVDDALAKGAKLEAGGERISLDGGTFYAPTVISNVDPEMIVMQEETFGPVAPIQKIESIEEAVALANDTPYGLAAYVFTESVAKGTKLIEQLNFGIVGWNDGLPSAAQAPFGGMKESGIGKEGGHEGLEAYLESQYVAIGLD